MRRIKHSAEGKCTDYTHVASYLAFGFTYCPLFTRKPFSLAFKVPNSISYTSLDIINSVLLVHVLGSLILKSKENELDSSF